MAINFKNFSSGINFGSLSSDPSGGENGDVYYNTTINAFRGFQNGIWQNLISNGGSVSAFLNAASNPITSTGGISGSPGTWQTFPNSPAFTFVPSVTGTYKIYCSMPLTPGPGNNVAFFGRVINTSGGATLLQESQILANGFQASVTDPGFSGYAQSTYILTAGTIYVFDLQGQVTSSGSLGLGGPVFYMFAEGVSLQGTLNTTGSSFNVFASNAIDTVSSPITSPTFETFDNSPAFTFTPNITGTYRVYSNISASAAGSELSSIYRIFNTSGGAVLLQESQGSVQVSSTVILASILVESIYQLTAGTTYVFDLQGQVASGGSAIIYGGNGQPFPTFYMFAEGIGLNNNSSQFPVKMKAFGSFSGSGNIVFTNISYDSNSAYNTSTGEYTIPYDGDYVAGFSAQSNSGGIIAIPLVNGALPNGAPSYFFDTSGQNGDIAAANVHMSCKKGDVVTWSSSSSTAYNSNSSLWIYSTALAQGLVGPQGSSGGSAFAFFASTQVNTLDSGITNTSFETFSNSPAFTFTPTISGIYKIYSSIPTQVQNSAVFAQCRIFNTSGGATLLQESQGTVYSQSGAPEISSIFVQSTYVLNAGTTYQFDIQGKADSGLIYNRGDESPFYMYSEGISLSPVLASPVGVVTTQFGVDPTTTGTLAQTAGSPIVFPYVFFDTTSSYNASSGQYTAPVAGYYDVVVTGIYFSGNQDDIFVMVNGVTKAGRLVQPGAPSGLGVVSGSSQVYLNYGDVLTIVADASDPLAYGAWTNSPSGYIPTITISLRPPTPAITSRIVKSLSTGSVGVPNGGPNPILDSGGVNPVTVTVACEGGDVEVGFMGDGTAPGYAGTDQSPTDSGMTIDFLRDGVVVHSEAMYMQNNISIEIHEIPASSFRFIDSPPPGNHTYTAQATLTNTNRSGQSSGMFSCVLFARPLA